MGWMPVFGTFSYGQRSKCADLSELLHYFTRLYDWRRIVRRKIYPWIICLMSTLLISCCMGITNGTFSVFQPYLVESGLTNTQASMILTVRNIFGCLAIAFSSQYYEHMGLRRGMTWNVCIGMIAFVIYSAARIYPVFMIGAAMSGICYGWGGILPASMLIRRWFKKNRTLALGISGSGSGVAMLILPVLLTSVIENKDMYAAFRLDALLMAITAVLLYLTIRESPEEAGLMPWGYEEENEKRKVVNEGAGLTSGEYAMLLVSMLFMGISTQPEVNHISVYFHELSFDPMLAPRTISVIGFFLIIGKCVYGYLVDIFQAFYVNLVYFLGIIAGLFFLVLCKSGNTVFAYMASVTLGYGTSLATVGMMSIAGDLETPEKYMRTGKYFQLIYLGAVLVFSAVPGIVADAAGSYLPVYILAPCLMIIGMILVQTVYIRHGKGFIHE